LVVPDEFELRENKISVDSPPVMAVIGKVIDDEAKAAIPRGNKNNFVSAI